LPATVPEHTERFMNTPAMALPSWSTSSFGASADATPTELSALGEHLNLCQATHRRLVALHCMAEAMHGFIAGRFVTTLAVAVLLIGAASLVA
jgi:hypothetical protein